VGTALCDHSLDNYAFFDPNLGCTKLHHNPAPFIRGFMPLTTLLLYSIKKKTNKFFITYQDA